MSIDQFLLSGDTTDLNYPEIRPSLDLNFARTKTLDPRITFTRGSGGSYVGADGLIKYAGVNEPRFDHDPETGESLGLLIEESRGNLVTDNNTYTLATRANITIDNSITSPDGKNGVQKVQSTITSGDFFSRSNSIVNSSGSTQNYTWSVFVKQGNLLTPTVRVQFGLINTAVLSYNFNTDTINNFSTVSFGRTLYPNGWVKLYGTTSITNGSTFNIIVVVPSAENAGGINAYFYQWGAQLEVGSFPTSYIPTQASTRTRAADNASITGKNFSSFYRQDEGTAFVNSSSPLSDLGVSFYLSETVLSDNIGIRGVPGNNVLQFLVFKNGIVQFLSPPPIRPTFKGCIGYKVNDTVGSFNGILSNTDNTVLLPSPISLQLGRVSNGSRYLNGHISRFTYYPKRLPNSQLQALTR